jgi:osomolarity two-component system response regulator SKN7
MLEEESAMYGGGESSKTRPKGAKRGSVGWGRGGTTFVVWDMNDFTTKIL